METLSKTLESAAVRSGGEDRKGHRERERQRESAGSERMTGCKVDGLSIVRPQSDPFGCSPLPRSGFGLGLSQSPFFRDASSSCTEELVDEFARMTCVS